MKVKIEIDESLQEEEVVIKAPSLNEKVQRIQEVIHDMSKSSKTMILYKGQVEYYLSLDDILFFETSDHHIHAHTKNDMYQIKYKLYELEEMLPGNFMRISKSTILNVKKIYAIHKTISSPCLIEFEDTHKQVYVSRHYYKPLKIRLEEKRL